MRTRLVCVVLCALFACISGIVVSCSGARSVSSERRARAATTQANVLADVVPTRLRCEYLTDPLAVDTEKPRLSWILQSDGRDVHQVAYQIIVQRSRPPSAPKESNVEYAEEAPVDSDREVVWDSGRVSSSETSQVEYAGAPLASGQELYWNVRVWTRTGDVERSQPSAWSEQASWRMGFLVPGDWKARWIASTNPLPEGDPPPPQPSPMLRKAFELSKPVRRAVATATALGLYELRINGKRAGDQLLAPNWTDYSRRIQYQAYDVTPMVRTGENVVGAVLGEGWYAGRIGISHIVPDGGLRNFYGRRLWLLAQIDVEYEDGSREAIATDGTWKSTTDGPIVSSCILDGEVYDARKKLPGWDAPGFDDSSWKPVEAQGVAEDSILASLVAQPNEPIRITEELRPVAMTEPKPGVYVFDLGQVLAGWCRLRTRGPAGTEVVLRHAEVLQQDGNIYRDNLRMSVYEKDAKLRWGKYLGARQEDRFILRGGGDYEVLEPHFTYHGFRYVEVTGLAEKPAIDSLLARAFHSAPPVAGSFECSDPLLNKLMKNIVWTLRDNLPSIPTDCPQRDERLGWMGDMLVFAQPACFLMDMGAFFTKWAQDIRDAQAADGRYPDFAPHPFDPNARFSGVPAWGDAGVVVPWRMHVNYGDRRVLEKHFESARRWVDWIHSKNPDLLWKNERKNDYGDWLNGDTLQLAMFGYPKGGCEVPKEVFATGFFQHSTELVAKMAQVLGLQAEAAAYGKLAQDIREAFRKAYVKEDGEVLGNTQAGYAMALYFDLMPENLRPAAVKRMVERIDAYKEHISTGFHTTIMLMAELTRSGRDDVAYKLILNRTIPSWGYTIDQGATTIWERWDGYAEGRGFQDPGMNSFCHYAIGSVAEWMYRAILGINPQESEPGYRRFTVRPRPGGGLTWAKGSYESIRGRIAVDWKLEGDGLSLAVTVPANTVATVHVPAADAAAVTEGDVPAAEAEGVRFLRMEGGAAIYEVGSGAYRFGLKTVKKG